MYVNLLAIFCNHQAKACSAASIARIKNLNRRTIDVLASRLYFYYSLSYELTGDLAEIRGYDVASASLIFFLFSFSCGTLKLLLQY